MGAVSKLAVAVIMLLCTHLAFSQQLRLGKDPYNVEKSAVLELYSDNQGLLLPRIADTSLINVLNPPDGMIIYFIPEKKLLIRANGYWQTLAINDSVVTSLNGNTGAVTMDTGYISNFYQKVRGLFSGGSGINYDFNTGVISSSINTGNFWNISGNPGTNSSTNFIGTTDNQDLVFKTNNTETARIVASTGDIKIGSTTTGTLRATQELVLRQDGDTYGSSILRLRNRTGENGAIFETTDPSITLVDFIFKTSASQRNIRYEARSGYAKAGTPSFHIGGASPDNPTLAVGDSYAAFNTNLKIGNYNTPTEALDVTGNVRFSGALMPNNSAGTSGYVLSSNGSGTAPSWKNFTLSNLNDVSLTSLSNGQLLQYNGTNWVNITPSYLTSVDTSNISNFYLKVRSELSGTAPITYNSSTGTIGITQATTSTNGYLSNTDWNTFNNKLSSYSETDPIVKAINGIVKSNGTTISAAVAGTDYLAPFGSQTAKYFYAAPNGSAGVPSFRAIVASDIPTLNQNTTGSAATLTTGRTISITGDLTYTSPAFNGSANVTAAGTLATVNANVGSFTAANITVNAKGLITAASNGTFDTTNISNFYTKVRSELSGTAPITYNSSTGEIGITQASSTTNGYLSSTDWNTFNNKSAALTFSTGLTNSSNTITNNLSTGISSSNQNIYGSTASGGTLTLNSTTNTTKGKILFGNSAYDEVNNYLNIGTTTSQNRITIGNTDKEAISRDIRTGSLEIMGGTSEATGAYFQITGDQHSGSPYEGSAEFVIRNLTNSQFAMFSYDGASTWTQRFQLKGVSGDTYLTPNGGMVSIGGITPTASLHLPAGTSSANTAPLKFTAGTNLTTPENGALEYNGTNLFITNGGVRETILTSATNFDTTNISNFYLKVRSELSGTAPITYNSSTGLIGITQATTSTNGYLSSTDWNTFNNKVDASSPTFSGITTINSLNLGVQSIATSGGTTTLTSGSPYYTIFTGSSTQSIVLPNATTLSVGQVYVIENNSTGAVTTKTNGGATLWIIAATAELRVILIANGTAAGTWQVDYLGGNYASGKLFTVNNTITFNGTDGTTMTLPTTSKTIAANDGSNWTFASQAIGDLPYATSTTAYGRLADVAANSPLLSGGVGTAPGYATYKFSGTAAATYTFPGATKTIAANDGSNWTFTSQAIGDLLYATSTTAYGRLASVAAGSFLRSGGVGIAPTWSTSTIPTSAGTAGKVLISDGTNYVLSTPTFPNASATTRKIIVSDGTNWTASTETYAVPGASGNLLISNGTNWTSGLPVTQAVSDNSTNVATTAFVKSSTQPMNSTFTVLTSGAAITWTPAIGTNIYTLTPGISPTINMGTIPAGMVGQYITLVITTSGTTSYTITAGTNLKMQGTLATGTTTAKKYVIQYLIESTTSVLEVSRTTAL